MGLFHCHKVGVSLIPEVQREREAEKVCGAEVERDGSSFSYVGCNDFVLVGVAGTVVQWYSVRGCHSKISHSHLLSVHHTKCVICICG